jgi:hypothetical protein
MEESERTLELFWSNHFIRLNKCLDLRKFEQKFKDVRTFFKKSLILKQMHICKTK